MPNITIRPSLLDVLVTVAALIVANYLWGWQGAVAVLGITLVMALVVIRYATREPMAMTAEEAGEYPDTEAELKREQYPKR